MELHKKRTRKLTPRQELAFSYYAKDKFRSKARALRKAGYSEAIARQPHKVFDSPAVKRELFYLGYSDRLSKHQKEHGKTIEEWKKETEEEREKIESMDEAIRQITPEQVEIIRKKLIEVGYDPYAKPLVRKKEVSSSYVPEGGGIDIFSLNGKTLINNDDTFRSLSSM